MSRADDRPTQTIVATRDDCLRATVLDEHPLHYADGPDVRLDRPAHVRAGSGVTWAGDRLVIVQDDANFLALVTPENGSTLGIALPSGKNNRRQFDDGGGNKKHKLDLEAVASVRDSTGELHIVAMSSGSKRVRDTIVVVRQLDGMRTPNDAPPIDTHRRPKFYEMLRAVPEFSGSELNIEGAVFLDDHQGGALRLFNRGNGKTGGAVPARNATADIAWSDFAACLANEDHIPSLGNIVHYALGELNSCPLGFTDAAIVSHNAELKHRITLFTAAAEASGDAVADGEVLGCVIGVITEDGDDIQVRWTPLLSANGDPFASKAEGIVLSRDEGRVALVVIDQDDAAIPSLLCRIGLTGPWW